MRASYKGYSVICDLCPSLPRGALARIHPHTILTSSSHEPHVGLKVEDRSLRELPEHGEQH